MDIKQIANSIAASLTAPVQYGANVNEGGGNGQVLQNIQNLGALEQQGSFANRATAALGTGAAAQDEAEKAQARVAAQAAKDEAEKKQKELDYIKDPKNYKKIVNDVGGYDFYDGMGGKITAREFASATNQHITDVYKDSQDPNDKDFTDDYNKVLELGKIIQSGDKKARDKFYKENPDWEKAYHNTPYNDIVKDLHNEYSGYFQSDKGMVRSDKFGSTTPSGTTLQNGTNVDRTKDKWGGYFDQLMPSWLGNASTYKHRV